LTIKFTQHTHFPSRALRRRFPPAPFGAGHFQVFY